MSALPTQVREGMLRAHRQEITNAHKEGHELKLDDEYKIASMLIDFDTDEERGRNQTSWVSQRSAQSRTSGGSGRL